MPPNPPPPPPRPLCSTSMQVRDLLQALEAANIAIDKEQIDNVDKMRCGILVGTAMGGMATFAQAIEDLTQRVTSFCHAPQPLPPSLPSSADLKHEMLLCYTTFDCDVLPLCGGLSLCDAAYVSHVHLCCQHHPDQPLQHPMPTSYSPHKCPLPLLMPPSPPPPCTRFSKYSTPCLEGTPVLTPAKLCMLE